MRSTDTPATPEPDATTSERFEAHIAPVRESLVRLLDVAGDVANDNGSLPDADSPAMAHLAAQAGYAAPGPWGSEPVQQAIGLGHLLVIGAEDSAKGACRLLSEDPTPVFSHVVLARSVLEHAGRAWWLFGPMDVRLRIARGMNERLNSLYEHERLPLDAPAKAASRGKHRSIVAEGGRLGFRKVISRRGKRAWLEEERPSSTAVIRRLLTDRDEPELGNAVYGYFSAVVHGTVLGMVQSVSLDAPDAPKTPGVTYGAVYTSSEAVCSTLAAMVLALSRLYVVRRDTLGWRSGRLDKAIMEAFRAVREALLPSESL